MTIALLILALVPQLLCFVVINQTPTTRSDRTKPTQRAEVSSESPLLEAGQAAKLRTANDSAEFKVVSYNIRWRSGNDLKEIIKQLREDAEIGGPTIVGLQEVDRQKKRSGKTNTAKLIAEELGFYYAWAAPPSPKSGAEEETGVALLSVYPLTDVRRIVLPHEGPGGRRRAAIGASVKVGQTQMRVYSAHAETRISSDKKLDQLNALLDDLKQHNPETPAIIMGDFNTWQYEAAPKTIKLFSDAGFTTPFGSQSTFSQKVLFVPVEFRLDWIWLRGLESMRCGIDKKIEISDHWPLWANLKIPSPKQ
jgi:endonuclease/exonuclease/phosphatase family metal-dependent hydrolase